MRTPWGVGGGLNISFHESDRVPHNNLVLSPALFDNSSAFSNFTILLLIEIQTSKTSTDWTGKVSTLSSFRVYGSCKLKGVYLFVYLVSCVLCKFFSATSSVNLGKKFVAFLIFFVFLPLK